MFGKIADAWKYMTLALALIPAIKELIAAIEVPGHGPEKLKTVVELVKECYAIIPDELKLAIGLDKVETFVTKVVTILVSYMNAVGLFRTGTQA